MSHSSAVQEEPVSPAETKCFLIAAAAASSPSDTRGRMEVFSSSSSSVTLCWNVSAVRWEVLLVPPGLPSDEGKAQPQWVMWEQNERKAIVWGCCGGGWAGGAAAALHSDTLERAPRCLHSRFLEVTPQRVNQLSMWAVKKCSKMIVSTRVQTHTSLANFTRNNCVVAPQHCKQTLLSTGFGA